MEKHSQWHLPVGANPENGGIRFRVWAPVNRHLEVVLFEGGREIGSHTLHKDGNGYFSGKVDFIGTGSKYMYRLDGQKLRPDPVSRYLPEGVHGVSEVRSPDDYPWTDHIWRGITPEKVNIYELHVGTFTPKGTFDGVISKLDYLQILGINAIELLPVADFQGERNWGYDGVSSYAPAHCYGKPEDLKRLVNEAHAHGLAVILDVVYNHFGPEGNYLRDFSPDYFTTGYSTPWGEGFNFGIAAVRDFFINNALYWVHEFHIDGLRLDATHAMHDLNGSQFLTELNQKIRASLPPGRNFLLYAEDERNDVRLIRTREEGGFGLDGVWADDFHHSMRALFAGDKEGYYQDFDGSIGELVQIINEGWLYRGQISKFSGKPRGTPAGNLPPSSYIHCIQNHDQVGNRPLGERLNHDVSAEAYRAMTALLLLSPYTPLLFQGQEWAARTPWQYFTDFSPELGKLVSEGRKQEFKGFNSFADQNIPDPQDIKTFENSKLNWGEPGITNHAHMLMLYKDLLHLRHLLNPLCQSRRGCHRALEVSKTALAILYSQKGEPEDFLLIVNAYGEVVINLIREETLVSRKGLWQEILSTENKRYGGRGFEACRYDRNSGQLLMWGACAMLFRVR